MLSCEFDEFIKIPAVQHTLEKNILRKTKNHLAGKFLLQDSSFKIIAPDAILWFSMGKPNNLFYLTYLYNHYFCKYR